LRTALAAIRRRDQLATAAAGRLQPAPERQRLSREGSPRRGVSRYATSAASAPGLPVREAARSSPSTNDLADDAPPPTSVNLPTSIQHVMLAIKNKRVAACVTSSARPK
jgi:hypothetical protein